MVTNELTLGTIQTYGTGSGYIYLHIPPYMCRQCDIGPKTAFIGVYRDGKLVLEQVKEGKHATNPRT